jgi:GNAT superfamily N-acetyltransferase
MEHLANSASAFWVAEHDGRLVGYARAFLREHSLQLTEFFVSPEAQSSGIGRELLTRVFSPVGVERRIVIATLDTRAQSLYLRSGVYPHFPISYFSRKPEANIVVANDLIFEPVTNTPGILDTIGSIDRQVLGYRRDVDHQHLLAQRNAYLYRRKGEPVGYGYLGHNSGPFALLDDSDFPAVLAHAEREAALSGERFGVDVPLINRAAVDYLLARGCRMDSFMEFYRKAP